MAKAGRPKGAKNKPKNLYKEKSGRRKQNKPRGLKGTKARANRVSRPTKSSGRRQSKAREERADKINEGQTNQGKNYNFRYARDLTDAQVDRIIADAIKRKKGAGRPPARSIRDSGLADASQFRNQQRVAQDILGKNMSLSRDPLSARQGFSRYNQEPTGRPASDFGGLRGGYGLNPTPEQRVKDQPVQVDKTKDPIVDLVERLESGGLKDRNIVITREEIPESVRNRRTYSARSNVRIEIEDPIKTGLRNIAETKAEAEKTRLQAKKVQEAVSKEKERREERASVLAVSQQKARERAKEQLKSDSPYLPPDLFRSREVVGNRPIYSAPDRRSRSKAQRITFFDDADSVASGDSGFGIPDSQVLAQQRVNKRKAQKKFQGVKSEIFASSVPPLKEGKQGDRVITEPSLAEELGLSNLGGRLRDFVRRPQTAPPSVAKKLVEAKANEITPVRVVSEPPEQLPKKRPPRPATQQKQTTLEDTQDDIEDLVDKLKSQVETEEAFRGARRLYDSQQEQRRRANRGNPRTPSAKPEGTAVPSTTTTEDIEGAEALLQIAQGEYQPSLDAIQTGRGATEGIIQGAFARINFPDDEVGVATGEPIPRTEPHPVSVDKTLQRELEVRKKATELEIRRAQEQANKDALARANRERRDRQGQANIDKVIRQVNRQSVRDNLSVVRPPDIVIEPTEEVQQLRNRELAETEGQVDKQASLRYGPQFSTPENEAELSGIQERERIIKLGLKKKYGIKAGKLNLGRFPRQEAPALVMAELYDLGRVQEMTAQEQMDLSTQVEELERLFQRRKQLENARKKSKGGKKKKK